MCLLTCLLLGCEIKLESCSRSLFSSGSGTSNKQSLPKSKKLDTSSSTKRTTCLDTNAVSSSVRLRIYYLSRYLDASLASSADFSQASMHKFLFQNPPILGRIWVDSRDKPTKQKVATTCALGSHGNTALKTSLNESHSNRGLQSRQPHRWRREAAQHLQATAFHPGILVSILVPSDSSSGVFLTVYNNLQYLLGNQDQNIYQNQALLRDLSWAGLHTTWNMRAWGSSWKHSHVHQSRILSTSAIFLEEGSK